VRVPSRLGPHALAPMRDLLRLALVRGVAGRFASLGIPVMPLKGALFAATLYDDPSERGGVDVDLLVPEASFGQAIDALGGLGFHPLPPERNPSERTVRAAGFPLDIDLHRALFAPGRYRLSTADVFARGCPDRDLFGEPVVRQSAYDAYAHVVGHEASAHQLPLDPKVAEDLRRLATRCRLDAGRCAAHLAAAGLGRAARYTLGLLRHADPFASEVLNRLPLDPVGQVLAAIATMVTGRFGPPRLVSRVAAHLTDRSLSHAALAVLGVPNRAGRAALSEPR